MQKQVDPTQGVVDWGGSNLEMFEKLTPLVDQLSFLGYTQNLDQKMERKIYYIFPIFLILFFFLHMYPKCKIDPPREANFSKQN